MNKYNTKENTKWFSPLNTQNLRLNASIWRWCGALTHQLTKAVFNLTWIIELVEELWGAFKVAIFELLALILGLLIIVTFPLSIPLLAIWRRHLARKYAKFEPERRKNFIKTMLGR